MDVGGAFPPTHYTMYPTESLSPDEFIRRFQGLPWEYSGKKRW